MSDTPLKSTAKKSASKKAAMEAGTKLRGADKVARIPIKVIPSTPDELLKKPPWLKVKISHSPKVERIKKILRKHALHSVCEEASCPNLSECFAGGTATFMIMGDICTRRCPFCDVGHGRPKPLDTDEPRHLAVAIAEMQLNYVVITSVDRDDLRDGGAEHFAECIRQARTHSPQLQIEILTPDFRGRMDPALDILTQTPPNIFNHNLETVPSLYRKARPGADYQWSLTLLKNYKARNPQVPTKSGLMLGLGETNEAVIDVMKTMRDHDIDMITLGQYLQPSLNHLKVERFVHPDEFAQLAETAKTLGFSKVASGALVRSSYHADEQAQGDMVI